MSSRKPNLHIQIDQLGDQYNSKFQGYVNYTQPNEYEPYYEPNNNQIYHSRTSNKSYHSIHSNNSDRSSLLQRAEQLMMENKLKQNLKSLSRSKLKNTSNFRNTQQGKYDQQSPKVQKNKKKIENVIIERQLARSKSASAVTRQNSRAKILQEIADKLKKVANRKKNQESNESQNQQSNLRYNFHFKQDQAKNNYQNNQTQNINQRTINYHNRINSSQSQSQNKSTVQKIKQFKQKLIKNRGGKLQHLLKDIKKSNKQVYKVVYTIKKSAKNKNNNDADFYPSYNQQTNIQDTNIYIGDDLIKQAKTNTNMKKIADELLNVRKQLKQVKNKNEQLLKISAMRSAKNSRKNNNDNASQSSRITNEIQALQMDVVSNNSEYQLKNSPEPTNSLPSFYTPYVRNQQRNFTYHNQSINSLNGQQFHNGYIIVQQPDFVQPCFACGCTCRGRVNKIQ